MNISEDIIKEMSKFGLTRYESQAYLVLLIKGVCSSKEVIESVGIPQPRIYDTMMGLERKGFIEIKEGRPRKFRAIDPETVFKKIQEDQELIVKQLQNLYKKEYVYYESPVWTVYGSQNMINKIRQMIRETKYELLLAVPEELIGKIKGDLKKAEERNVFISTVLYNHAKTYPDLRNVWIFDREVPAMIIVLKDRDQGFACPYKFLKGEGRVIDERYGILIENKELLHILSDFFLNTIWKTSRRILEELDVRSKSFVHIAIAIHEYKKLEKEGYNVRAKVMGKRTGDNMPIEIEGNIKGVEESSIIHRIVIETKDKQITVGGWDSTKEDIEMEIITLYPTKDDRL